MNVTASYHSILNAVDYDDLTSDEQDAFVSNLNSVIFRGAVVRIVERMDAKTLEAWYELLESGASEEKMRTFLERNVPGADLALAETVESLADDILAVTR